MVTKNLPINLNVSDYKSMFVYVNISFRVYCIVLQFAG